MDIAILNYQKSSLGWWWFLHVWLHILFFGLMMMVISACMVAYFVVWVDDDDCIFEVHNTALLSSWLGKPMLESLGSGNGSNVQDHKRLKHHILTQNLKTMGLWVSFLIYPLFPPFIVDVEHNHSHLITQQIACWLHIRSLMNWDTMTNNFTSLWLSNNGCKIFIFARSLRMIIDLYGFF